MAKAKVTGKSLAAAMCRKFPNTPNTTLGKKLYKEHVARFPTLNAACCAIRRVRGNQGEEHRNRKQSTVKDVARPNGKAGYIPACPPSAAEPWLPVELDAPCRVLSLSDIHIPYHHQQALEAAVEWGRKFKPDVLLLNGDIIDFHRISRWEQRPEKRDTKFEIDQCKELLRWLRHKFPKARFIFKLGNHDERLDKYVYLKAPELWNLEAIQLHNILDFEKYSIERVDSQPILAGFLPILHGHETGKTMTSPVNAARGLYLRVRHTALQGHLHQSSNHGDTDLWHSETSCWSQGCLCDLTPEFLRVNRWNHGFAAIEVAKDRQFDLHNMKIINNKVRSA